MKSILNHCHTRDVGGYCVTKTTAKYFNLDFIGLLYINACDACQRSGNISRRNKMPLNNILEVEIFDVWGIDFMGLFSPFFKSIYPYCCSLSL